MDSTASGKRVFTAEAEEIRSNPGVWFVLRKWPKNHTQQDKARGNALATNIRAGKAAAFRPAGAFDAKARKHDDGTFKVHVMFVQAEEDKTE